MHNLWFIFQTSLIDVNTAQFCIMNINEHHICAKTAMRTMLNHSKDIYSFLRICNGCNILLARILRVRLPFSPKSYRSQSYIVVYRYLDHSTPTLYDSLKLPVSLILKPNTGPTNRCTSIKSP